MKKRMNRLMTTTMAALLGIALCCVSPALAEEDHLSVGIVAATASTIYKGADDKIVVLPMVSYRSGGFFIDATSVGYSLVNTEEFQFEVFGEYNFMGYKASDSSYLRGMKRRKEAIEAGVQADVMTDLGLFSVSFQGDVSSRHNGYSAELTYALPLIETERFSLFPAVGVTWLSEDMINYYYGVRSSEALPGRSAYTPGSAVNPYVSVDVSYQLAECWMLTANLAGVALDKEIRNSPLVDKDYELSVVAGVVYHFW